MIQQTNFQPINPYPCQVDNNRQHEHPYSSSVYNLEEDDRSLQGSRDDDGFILDRCDSIATSTTTTITTDYSTSILYTRAQNVINQVEVIETLSRRQRQESFAIEAVDDLMIAPIDCLEGLRSVQHQYNNDRAEFLNDIHIDVEGALADDLSSCPDDDNVSTPQNRCLEYSVDGSNKVVRHDYNSNHGDELHELQSRIVACYQAVIAIQANADIREAKLQLEVSKLQTELEIERTRNTQLSVHLELMRKQQDDEDDCIVDSDAVRVETHLNNLVLKCQKYLSENLTLKQKLYDKSTAAEISARAKEKNFLKRKTLLQVLEKNRHNHAIDNVIDNTNQYAKSDSNRSLVECQSVTKISGVTEGIHLSTMLPLDSTSTNSSTSMVGVRSSAILTNTSVTSPTMSSVGIVGRINTSAVSVQDHSAHYNCSPTKRATAKSSAMIARAAMHSPTKYNVIDTLENKTKTEACQGSNPTSLSSTQSSFCKADNDNLDRCTSSHEAELSNSIQRVANKSSIHSSIGRTEGRLSGTVTRTAISSPTKPIITKKSLNATTNNLSSRSMSPTKTKMISSPVRRPTYLAFTQKILRGQHVPMSSPVASNPNAGHDTATRTFVAKSDTQSDFTAATMSSLASSLYTDDHQSPSLSTSFQSQEL